MKVQVKSIGTDAETLLETMAIASARVQALHTAVKAASEAFIKAKSELEYFSTVLGQLENIELTIEVEEQKIQWWRRVAAWVVCRIKKIRRT